MWSYIDEVVIRRQASRLVNLIGAFYRPDYPNLMTEALVERDL